MQVLIKSLLREKEVSIKHIYHLICLLMENLNICFVPKGMHATCIFYKIIVISSFITFVCVGYNYTLVDLPIHGEHFKPNANPVDECKQSYGTA